MSHNNIKKADKVTSGVNALKAVMEKVKGLTSRNKARPVSVKTPQTPAESLSFGGPTTSGATYTQIPGVGSGAGGITIGGSTPVKNAPPVKVKNAPTAPAGQKGVELYGKDTGYELRNSAGVNVKNQVDAESGRWISGDKNINRPKSLDGGPGFQDMRSPSSGHTRPGNSWGGRSNRYSTNITDPSFLRRNKRLLAEAGLLGGGLGAGALLAGGGGGAPAAAAGAAGAAGAAPGLSLSPGSLGAGLADMLPLEARNYLQQALGQDGYVRAMRGLGGAGIGAGIGLGAGAIGNLMSPRKKRKSLFEDAISSALIGGGLGGAAGAIDPIYNAVSGAMGAS